MLSYATSSKLEQIWATTGRGLKKEKDKSVLQDFKSHRKADGVLGGTEAVTDVIVHDCSTTCSPKLL